MTCRISIYVIGILVFASGCSGTRQSSSPAKGSTSSQTKVVNKDPKFLDDISVTPESSSTSVKGSKQKNNNRNCKVKELLLVAVVVSLSFLVVSNFFFLEVEVKKR